MSAYQDGIATIPARPAVAPTPSQPMGAAGVTAIVVGAYALGKVCGGLITVTRTARRRAPQFVDRFGRPL